MFAKMISTYITYIRVTGERANSIYTANRVCLIKRLNTRAGSSRGLFQRDIHSQLWRLLLTLPSSKSVCLHFKGFIQSIEMGTFFYLNLFICIDKVISIVVNTLTSVFCFRSIDPILSHHLHISFSFKSSPLPLSVCPSVLCTDPDNFSGGGVGSDGYLSLPGVGGPRHIFCNFIM